jgi:hypothetical protein
MSRKRSIPRWARNPRRAYNAEGQVITPVTIACMRAEGTTWVTAYCETPGCSHEGRIDVTDWPGEVYVPDIGLFLRCTACGSRNGARIMPDRQWVPGMGKPPLGAAGAS